MAFYFRIYKTNLFENEILDWIHRQSALYFCTLFQFMLGAFALKYNWHTKVSYLFQRLKNKNVVAVLIILLAIIFHGLIPNFVVAPFTALVFIFMFLQIKCPLCLNRFLNFFTPHATNLWLIHMFFYMIYFSDFVYSFNYVPLIFTVLVIMCVVTSYLVNFINKKVQKIT